MALLEQELARRDDRLRMEPPARSPAEQHVGERDDAHALVMRHVGADDRNLVADRHAGRRVVEGLEIAEAAAATFGGDRLVVAEGRHRIDHGGKPGGIGSDDGAGGKPALQAETGNAEV